MDHQICSQLSAAGLQWLRFTDCWPGLHFYSHGFGNLIKGTEEILIRDGELVHRGLRSNHITRHDLEEDLRLDLHSDDLKRIRSARLERSGGISFICE